MTVKKKWALFVGIILLALLAVFFRYAGVGEYTGVKKQYGRLGLNILTA